MRVKGSGCWVLGAGERQTRTQYLAPSTLTSSLFFGVECRRDYIHPVKVVAATSCRPLFLSLFECGECRCEYMGNRENGSRLVSCNDRQKRSSSLTNLVA